MTTMTSIRCGRCSKRHASVDEVRACYNGQTVDSTPEALPASERATTKQVDFLLKLVARLGGEPNRAGYESLSKRAISAKIDEALESLKHQPKAQTTSVADLPKVEDGHYAVKSHTGNNDLDFYRIKNGRRPGIVFIDVVVGGHPDQPVARAIRARVMAAIAKDPQTAAKAYADAIGNCYKCNRHLTDETSRALGIGPQCRAGG